MNDRATARVPALRYSRSSEGFDRVNFTGAGFFPAPSKPITWVSLSVVASVEGFILWICVGQVSYP